MGQRTLYPKPECPECGNSDTFVKNTYYTEEGEILRNRKCYLCEESYWTLQEPEQRFPDTWQLEFPKKFGNARDSKRIIINK